jgi:hypothetical protein
MELKWRKLPSPEKLAKLPASVVAAGIPFLQSEAPRLQRTIIDRTLSGFGVDLNGDSAPLPPYSKRYRKRKAEAQGRETARPNYSLNGALLDHLSAKIKAEPRVKGLSLVIAAYGRHSEDYQLTDGPNERLNRLSETKEVSRAAYTYTNARGKTVNVPAGKMNARSLSAYQKRMDYKYRNYYRYNAHLAWALAHRDGQGGIRGLTGPPTHHFIRATNRDLAAMRDRWVESLSSAGIFGVWAQSRVQLR